METSAAFHTIPHSTLRTDLSFNLGVSFNGTEGEQVLIEKYVQGFHVAIPGPDTHEAG